MNFQKLHVQAHECMEARQQPVGPGSPPTCGSQGPSSGSHLTHSAICGPYLWLLHRTKNQTPIHKKQQREDVELKPGWQPCPITLSTARSTSQVRPLSKHISKANPTDEDCNYIPVWFTHTLRLTL